MTLTALRSARTLLALAATALVCVLPLRAQQAPSVRSIEGIVTDTSHEPLRGAAVELRNPADNSVISRLTDATGHYTFKRVDGNTDFVLRASYRGHETHAQSISKFDSHMAKKINFTVAAH